MKSNLLSKGGALLMALLFLMIISGSTCPKEEEEEKAEVISCYQVRYKGYTYSFGGVLEMGGYCDTNNTMSYSSTAYNSETDSYHIFHLVCSRSCLVSAEYIGPSD